MSKPTKQKQALPAVQISRAAQASRKMTIQERAKIMVKAGLVSQKQADQAAKVK
jgi:hypothetical protein